MDYAQQLERIEAKKAKERKKRKSFDPDRGPEQKGETRDIVGKASGFGSGST